MNIEKRLINYNNREDSFYGIMYRSEWNIFMKMDEFWTDSMRWVQLSKFAEKDFLINNKIDFIIEDDRIIPIGIVDFKTNSNSSQMDFYIDRKEDLYGLDKIIENIERAFEIKYKLDEFRRSFKNLNIAKWEPLKIDSDKVK